jgi:hypothetical protein
MPSALRALVAAMMPAVLAVRTLWIAASFFAVRGCSGFSLLARCALSPTRKGQHDHYGEYQNQTLHVNSLIVLPICFLSIHFLANLED